MLLVYCQELKKIPRPRGLVSWLPTTDRPVLGTSMVGGSTPGSAASSVTGLPSALSLPRSSSAPAAGLPVLPPVTPSGLASCSGHVLHPFSMNHFDAGPDRRASIAHAVDYRIAVLRDGIKQASVRPGTVPFMSCRAGAYGWLALATHERMMTGGLVACDWLRPVTQGAWRVAPPISVVTHTAMS